MVPAFIIWICGGIMVICGVFLERRLMIAGLGLAGTVVMGVTSNAVTILGTLGAGMWSLEPQMFVPATCTFGAIAVLAIYFTIVACRGKISRPACLISWAVASWFVGFSYVAFAALQLAGGE